MMKLSISVAVLAMSTVVSLAGTPLVEELMRDLTSELVSVRRNAAVALGGTGDKSAVPALIRALGDKDAGVRSRAAKALGDLRDSRATPALVDGLGDTDANVRTYAAYALGEIKDPKAGDALSRALDDPVYSVRDQAAWALRELRDPKLVAPLVAALASPEADVPHIMWILGQMGGDKVVEAVSGLLVHKEEAVRMRALNILIDLDDKSVIESLITVLNDKSSAIRLAAVNALIETGDTRAKAPFQTLIERETDATVREAAREGLVKLSRHPALAAWWSFDDRSTQTAKDISGGGTDGTVTGCRTVKGKIGHALEFGPEGCVELGRPTGLSIQNTPFTVMAWVKSTADNGVVVARGGAFQGYSLYIKDGVGKFGIHRVEDGPLFVAAGTDRLVGGWVHMAGVVKEKQIELYVNGKLAGAAETDGYVPGNCGQGMEIGFDEGNSPAEIVDHFQGIIDEVKAYSAALSADEIEKEANPE